ncbi:lITAF domain-containing protein [Gouania willdenowi]|uniref:Lipopolysaccharide-induced tumor necrosis factor-alpha factor homolog n=1 Tax=Gouania willdenowi TaxID=441366 RepID=A0A8C5H5X3_GOUWI|nr:lipopolysaccharide-induced tumor necrosis factor-alpha factor homolog [Gouania willdenowi]
MSGDGNQGVELPPYIIPSQEDVKLYKVHSPFHPQDNPRPVVTTGVGNADGDGRTKYVSYDTGLGFNSGTTTCTSCQQQVRTDVTYKAGTYAWLMCLLFICCGLFLCCCLIPFFMDRFKDAHHTCPICHRVLHVEKRKCCK